VIEGQDQFVEACRAHQIPLNEDFFISARFPLLLRVSGWVSLLLSAVRLSVGRQMGDRVVVVTADRLEL
jgi:hypothetical protein